MNFLVLGFDNDMKKIQYISCEKIVNTIILFFLTGASYGLWPDDSVFNLRYFGKIIIKCVYILFNRLFNSLWDTVSWN